VGAQIDAYVKSLVQVDLLNVW